MRKVLFGIFGFFFLFSFVIAKENKPLQLVNIVNRCSVVDDNRIVVPVRVLSRNEGTLTDLINEYTLGYVDNDRDNVVIRITNISGVQNVSVDNNRDSKGRSLIRYYVDKEIKGKKLDTIFEFDMQIEFLNSVPDSISILENSVVISSKDVCDKINGYRVNEVEKIMYVDVIKNENSNKKLFLVIIVLLIVIIFVLGIILIRKSKNK